jgi:hypothetical protein
MPEGVNQCWCEPIIVHLTEYRNPKNEYEVHVPDGIAEILGCSGTGHGFKVSLDHPESGDGDYGLNQIEVLGAEHQDTFQKILDTWRLKTSNKKDDVTDEQFDQPEPMSLSSLPAFRLKSTRIDPHYGKIVAEEIVANNPHKDIVYYVVMISPADRYEKNQMLFKAIIDGFRYVPSSQGAQP